MSTYTHLILEVFCSNGWNEDDLEIRPDIVFLSNHIKALSIINAPILIIKAEENSNPKLSIKLWNKMTMGGMGN